MRVKATNIDMKVQESRQANVQMESDVDEIKDWHGTKLKDWMN